MALVWMINPMFTVIINSIFDDAINNLDETPCIEQSLFNALALKTPYPYADLYLKNNELDQQLLCLTPMSFVVGMRDVLLQAMPEQLDITDDEYQQMVQLLTPLMNVDDLLFVQDKTKFYLKSNRKISTTPYFKLAKVPIKESLPKGEEQAFWSRLFSECQMVLSQAPFNLMRQQEGKPPINALWFWGEGKWLFSNKSFTLVTDNVFLANKVLALDSVTLLSVSDFLNLTVNKQSEAMIVYLSETTPLIEKKIIQLNRKHTVRRVWKNGQYTLSRQTLLSRLFNKKRKLI